LESDSSVLVTTTRRRLTDTSNVILGGCFLIWVSVSISDRLVFSPLPYPPSSLSL
jgi:hypothetical protein